MKLKSVTAKDNIVDGGVPMYGYGMKNEEVPKLVNFGKNIILLNKLYYKNILSVKNKKMHSVEHMPNVKVSDTLADIICNMCKNEQPTKQILDTLKTGERELFDLLLHVSGLGKSKHLSKEIDNKKNTIIKELKERLKLVEAEIQAGNNNPVVKAELKEIVNKLVLYNVISQNNGKKYLQQF
jgi:ABC-type antimicrobial peptide transport system permease subunit